LPKRVIDVLAATPDVVLVNSDGGRGQYTCLSHPWGDEVPLRTTIRNLQTHQNRIPFEKLPLTFQDAVKITRRIGVRWIWIDSLCIIQDDSLDWEKESSTMAAIYSNSYLTIAATSSERPSDGFRSPRSMNLLDGFYFRDVTSQMEQCKSIRGIQDFNQPTNSLPLLRRAWVFQERLLSPRVLHFAWCEMVWECRSGVICECTPGDVDKSVIEGAKRLYHQATSECESVLLPFSTWCQLSRAYFKCRITFAEDRLPALSGLARAFQEKNPTVGRYLAGIWSDNLLRGLLW
ncbi:HET-domain-containing protein, partial [Stipitochalara longipes BDJ]